MKIKYKLRFFLLFLYSISLTAQKKDSIPEQKSVKLVNTKQFIVPTALIASGLFLVNNGSNTNLQTNANHFFGNNFKTRADDFLLFVPAIQMCFGKYLGFKPKTDFEHQVIQVLMANFISVSITETLKRSYKVQRPDLSDFLSFPSGHTTIAFTNAALFYNDYKDTNLGYACSGFLFSTATGVLRVANNKHYVSDVLTGAGIGLATGFMVSYLKPLKSVTFLKNKKATAFVYPQFGNQIGIGALVSIN